MSEPKPSDHRRDFLRKCSATIISAVLGLVPLVAGLIPFCDPLRRKGRGAKFLTVVPLAALPADGRPMIFKVRDDFTDAWNRQLQVPIGNVYLRRVGECEVQAFNATCPHLGCMVEARENGAFLCPCHNSRFTANGRIDHASGGIVPSPRDMDALEVKIETADGVEMVAVKFQNFVVGHREKIPVA